MKTRFVAENPNAIEFTISITMTLAEWKSLKEQLEVAKHPASRIHAAIRDVTTAAQQIFEPARPELNEGE